MSFGLDIVIDAHTEDEEWVEVVDGHTYNLAPMWKKALPRLLASGSTSDLNGKPCEDVLPHLLEGLQDAVLNEPDYRALEPSNGWGDYEGFLLIYRRFTRLCHENPRGVIVWNG